MPRDSLETLSLLRKRFPPIGDDPRLDLAEAEADDALADFEKGIAASKRAAERAALLGERRLVALASLEEAGAFINTGKMDEARTAIESGRTIARGVNDVASLGQSAKLLGNVAFFLGRFDESRARYEEAGRTFEGVGNRGAAAAAWNNVGNVL